MKRQIFLLIALCLFSERIFCSDLESFFKIRGIGLVASLAHPTNHLVEFQYQETPSLITINLIYKEGYHTKIAIGRIGNLLTSVNVIEDSDWINAFAATTNYKEIIERLLQEIDKRLEQKTEKTQKVIHQSEIKIQIENLIKRKLDEADGKDFTLILLNFGWLNY